MNDESPVPNNNPIPEAVMAGRYGVTVQTLRNWARRGEFPASFRLGGKRFYNSSEYDKWVSTRRAELAGGVA